MIPSLIGVRFAAVVAGPGRLLGPSDGALVDEAPVGMAPTVGPGSAGRPWGPAVAGSTGGPRPSPVGAPLGPSASGATVTVVPQAVG